MTNEMKQTKHKKEEIPLNEIPTLASIKCRFNSDKVKSRKAVYFGEVTLDGKVIRQGEYLLIQNENIHRNECRKFEHVPRGDR